MADNYKKDIRELNEQMIKLTIEQGNLRAKLALLDKAQTLYVDQIQWMRGFCEEHVREQRLQFDRLIFPNKDSSP